MNPRPKLAFLDAEFTGEHKGTTLVSLGVVGENDEELYVTFNDYDKRQVTPWLEENVLAHIDESKSVSQEEGFKIISNWFDNYSGGQKVSCVSFGKTIDFTLFFELWHYAFPEREYFHYLYCLPDYLNHAAHFDLSSIFALSGINPDVNREELLQSEISGVRHNALYDAKVVKECFFKFVNQTNFPNQIVL